MGFGLGVLRLSPDAFWRMTPLELAAALHGLRGAAEPLTSGDVRRLMDAFPDADEEQLP